MRVSSWSTALIVASVATLGETTVRHELCWGFLGKNGTYSEYITLPIRNLHLVPDNVDNETAVFVEPLAAACSIIEQKVINVRTDRVAVIGDGKLGLLIMEVLGRQPFSKQKPMIIGHHPEKMRLLEGFVLKWLC